MLILITSQTSFLQTLFQDAYTLNILKQFFAQVYSYIRPMILLLILVSCDKLMFSFIYI